MESRDLYVVGVGASAGGQQAIQEFFSNIPPDLPVAFVVVTHLLRNYESQLHKIISRHTKLKVVRLKGLTQLERGHIYVMPENVEVRVARQTVYLKLRGEDGINKSIDVFLASLAKEFKERAIAVIFSGMGSDGAEGAIKIHEHDGEVFVQEPASSQFDSMPWATIMKDSPDHILPPRQLADTLVRLIKEKDVQIAK